MSVWLCARQTDTHSWLLLMTSAPDLRWKTLWKTFWQSSLNEVFRIWCGGVHMCFHFFKDLHLKGMHFAIAEFSHLVCRLVFDHSLFYTRIIWNGSNPRQPVATKLIEPLQRVCMSSTHRVYCFMLTILFCVFWGTPIQGTLVFHSFLCCMKVNKQMLKTCFSWAIHHCFYLRLSVHVLQLCCYAD